MKDIDSKAGEAGEQKDACLRERLRAGDPASGAAPLATEEIQAMRRAMLAAIPEARPAVPWRLPAFAMAGLGLMAALGFALHAWLSGGAVSPSGRGEAGPVVAEVSAPSGPDGASRHELLPRAGSPPSGTVRSPRTASPRPRVVPLAPRPPAVQRASADPGAPLAAEEAAAPAIRELQFSTPGGTRIVWVFASGDAPVSETPRPARL